MNSPKTFLQVSYLSQVPVITVLRKQIWTEKGGPGPMVTLQPCLCWVSMLVLVPLHRRWAPFLQSWQEMHPPSLPLSPGVMGDEDVSCHSVQDRESFNPGFTIRGIAGNWTSAPESEQAARTSPLAYPALVARQQANLSPSCFIYTWCLLPLTWILTLRVGGISRKTTFVVCH